MIAAIVLWVCAGIYAVLFVVLMITSHTARTFVLGSIKSIRTRQDALTGTMLSSVTISNKVARVEDRTSLIALDSTLTHLAEIYHQIGEKAIAYSLDDYEQNYLYNRNDYTDIVHKSANHHEAVLRGLERYFKRTFILQPPLVNIESRHQDVPVSPLLLEAEASDAQLRQTKDIVDTYFIRLRDSLLHDECEFYRKMLLISESYRIMCQLYTHYGYDSASSERADAYNMAWREIDGGLAVLRATIQKRVTRLLKPWWIRWIYA